MSDFQCEVCGTKYERPVLPLMPRQERILAAIEKGKRDLGKLPSAKTIAVQVGRPLATVKVELHALEEMERVHRPNGPKSGWDIRADQSVRLIRVRKQVAA
jgi:hypothetical protein